MCGNAEILVTAVTYYSNVRPLKNSLRLKPEDDQYYAAPYLFAEKRMYRIEDGMSNTWVWMVGAEEAVTFTRDQSVLATMCRIFRRCYTARYSE